MRLSLAARDVPSRLATGGFVLHTGANKWNETPETAAAVRGAAVTAFPFLTEIPPEKFLRMLAVSEIATGTALLLPLIPSKLAGLALVGFSGSLLAMYWRTPGMRKPGSIWPTPKGVAISKDVWMLGIGLSLLMSDS
jgi:uncharacterized membrane protein YphA (DoxX/SURF4 family)